MFFKVNMPLNGWNGLTSLVHKRTATAHDLEAVNLLLLANDLPHLEPEVNLRNFAIIENSEGRLVGVAGFEQYGKSALLRSVATRKEYRGRGYARILVELVLENAKAAGVNKVYLLTNTAKDYFTRLGFRPVDRSIVEEDVKSSFEFSEICKSALVMLRDL